MRHVWWGEPHVTRTHVAGFSSHGQAHVTLNYYADLLIGVGECIG